MSLEELAKAQHQIGCDLLDGDVAPCTEQKYVSKSCTMAEEERPLTKNEKDKWWGRRPFYAYDPERMCGGCRAYWYASMAANELRDLVCREALRKAEEERNPPKAGG